MGQTTSVPTPHELHDIASRRQRNRDAFGPAVLAWREELARGCSSADALKVGPRPVTRPLVLVRKRPLFEREAEADFDVVSCFGGLGEAQVWMARNLLKADARHMFAEHHGYAFDAAFGEDAATAELYAPVAPMVAAARGGRSALVLLFGATGSGKTYTTQGLLELVAADLAATPPAAVVALEIDGPKVTDLLHASARCELREDTQGHVRAVAGRGSPDPAVPVASAAEALRILQDAAARRSTHATGVHDASSRTHAIYRFLFAATDLPPPVASAYPSAPAEAPGPEPAEAGEEGVPAPARELYGGELSVADLAGSEWARDQQSHSAERRAEARNVNASLSVLKACLRARESKTPGRLPVREQKLTRALSESLVAEELHTVVVACVSPSSADTEHTMDTLFHTCVARPGLRARAPGGHLVLTRPVGGTAVLDKEAESAKPRAGGVAGWDTERVLEWWCAAGEQAVSAAKAEQAAGTFQRWDVALRTVGEHAWPAGQKLGLALDGNTVTKVGSMLTRRFPMMRPGSQVVSVQDAGVQDLRAATAELAAAASSLERAKACKAAEDRRKAREAPTQEQLAIRAWILNGAGTGAATADSEYRAPLEEATETAAPEPVDPAELAAAEAFTLRLGFTDAPSLGQPPRVPRIFTSDSRLGAADGTVLVQQFGNQETGLVQLCGACEGDGAVARHMYAALRSAIAASADVVAAPA